MKSKLVNKKLLAAVGIGIVSIASQNANATGQEFSGKTTCYIFKNDKFSKKASCTYTGLEFGSIRYNEISYDFKVPSVGKISTGVSVAAKTDKNGKMIEGKDGSVEYDDSEVTINGKPAHSQERYIEGYKVIAPKLLQNGFEKFEKTGLSCMQSNDKKLEVCIPLKDGYLGGL